jgi:flagellin
MALGVLNNLSAMYAEHYLNNTNASLQTVLQQLSSGSRINSGADDAAGLSLVNGLQANQTALTQSATNATEGVGLLQVADGALSQVTNLLNRAITLATEASNGTLNATQENAANQEYQSIMAEITNIGSTTTYNQQQVFSGRSVDIFTGDSSTSGSSIDKLYIRGLSAGSVGDSNGVMSYSNGQSNVFIDLSKGGKLATLNDALANATTSIDVNYLAMGGGGALTTQTVTISVGGATGYANTTQGLINAINDANLGMTATFGTASQAGSQAVGAGAATDTGIIVSGITTGVGSGTTPGKLGSLALAGVGVLASDVLSGTLQVTDSAGTVHSVTLNGATDNFASLTTALAAYGITTTVAGTTATFVSASSKASITSGTITDITHPAATATFTAGGAYYGIGIQNHGGNDVEDLATGQVLPAGFTADPTGLGGVATMSYSDSAGVSMLGTDLLTQPNAQNALNQLNLAISAVASLDGYIGAQINTLNSLTQIMTTQKENVTAAQNAIQATDYASATSNLSKFEILSQTGIAALAQANSIQQEVTKLLQ